MTDPTEPSMGSRSLAAAVEEVIGTFWDIGSALVAAGRGALTLLHRAYGVLGGSADEDARFASSASSGLAPDDSAPATPPPRIHLEAHDRLSSAVALESDAVATGASRPAGAPEAPIEGPSAARAERQAPLPAQYGADRLTVLPRDPQSVFAFWEVRSETLERVRARLRRTVGEAADGLGRLALRLTRLEADAQPGGDAVTLLLLPPRAVSWYIDLDPAVRRIEVALGLSAGDAFLELAPPVAVSLPPRSVAPDAAPRWRTASGEPPPPDMLPQQPAAEVSASLLRTVGARVGSSAQHAPGPHLLELEFVGSHSAPRR